VKPTSQTVRAGPDIPALPRRRLPSDGSLDRLRRSASRLLARFTLFQRFMLLSLVILLVGAYVIGSYVSGEIRDRVIHRTSALTALYVDSVVSPHLQELRTGHDISAGHVAELDQLVVSSALGRKIASFKVWHTDGDIVWAKNPELIGRQFPIGHDLDGALRGNIETHMSNLEDDENVYERTGWDQLLETYAPVRADKTGDIIGAVEFYQDPGDLNAEISASQQTGWLIVGGATGVMYILLVGMVRGASSTITRQHQRLDRLARQNAALARRVGRAAAAKTETDELLLKRIAQDLHDGPAQDIGLVLLRLDSIQSAHPTDNAPGDDLALMKTALNSALTEIRHISAGLQLPEMEGIDLGSVIRKAVQSHRDKTGDMVRLSVCAGLPEVGLPIKIALYRVTQEALNNIHLHAGVTSASVRLDTTDDSLVLQIRDHGRGGAAERREDAAGHGASLGIRGMRERIEMLGGALTITSTPGEGTFVLAALPLDEG